MNVKLCKEDGYLYPALGEDKEVLDKIPEGEMFGANILRIRDPKTHRRYFALLKIAFENQQPPFSGDNEFQDFDNFRKYFEMKAGYYQKVKVPGKDQGKFITLYWPKSISYASLDEDAFKEVFSNVMDQIAKIFGFDPNTMEDEINKR